MDDRRSFQRLDISETAQAYDTGGRLLGKVSQVSGGGMLILPESAAVAQQMLVGTRHTVTITEPSTNNKHSIDVVVRYSANDRVGVEFVGGKN